MTATLFGFMSDAKEAISEFINGCLLIAGGFLVGYLLGGVIGWALGKYALRQQEPDTLKRIGRPVGGILLALIVAIIVFTGKGKPHGEGGDGKGTPSTDPNAGKDHKTDPNTKIDPNITPPKVDVKPADVTIRVTILGGTDVQNDRFYLIDDDRSPKTFTELKEAVAARRGKEKGKVALKLVLPPPPNPNRLPKNHPAITQVQDWAYDEGLEAPLVKGT